MIIKFYYNQLHHLSQGEFNDKINQDLGLFNSLKDELNCINDGFKDAVSKEVASQKVKTELISNVSHDLKITFNIYYFLY